MNSPCKSCFKIIRRGQRIQLHHVKHFSVYRYNKDIHHQKNNKNGLRKQVLDVCDHLYKIPTGGNMRNNNNNTDNTNKKISSVDSLNVGVSVGISLWQLLST